MECCMQRLYHRYFEETSRLTPQAWLEQFVRTAKCLDEQGMQENYGFVRSDSEGGAPWMIHADPCASLQDILGCLRKQDLLRVGACYTSKNLRTMTKDALLMYCSQHIKRDIRPLIHTLEQMSSKQLACVLKTYEAGGSIEYRHGAAQPCGCLLPCLYCFESNNTDTLLIPQEIMDALSSEFMHLLKAKQQRGDLLYRVVVNLCWLHGCMFLDEVVAAANDVLVRIKAPLCSSGRGSLSPTNVQELIELLSQQCCSRRGLVSYDKRHGCVYWHHYPTSDRAARLREIQKPSHNLPDKEKLRLATAHSVWEWAGSLRSIRALADFLRERLPLDVAPEQFVALVLYGVIALVQRGGSPSDVLRLLELHDIPVECAYLKGIKPLVEQVVDELVSWRGVYPEDSYKFIYSLEKYEEHCMPYAPNNKILY